jgi:predicted RNA-binding protein YlxR (DUF448 family)
MRTCITCYEKRPKRLLIRLVRTPVGSIEVDPGGKLSGRGAYVCPEESCWTAALQQGKLGRALKCPVSREVVGVLKVKLQESADGMARAEGEEENA